MRIAGLICLACLLSIVQAEAETLTLKDCLSSAAAANHALKVASFDEKTAAENITVARSGFLPRVDFQGGYTAQLEPQSIRFATGSFKTQEADYAFFGLAVNQTLYDFGRTEARSQRAALLREADALDYSGLEKDIFLQVVQGYFSILENRKLMQTAAEEVMQRKEHLRVARNLFEQGVVTRNDLLQAEVKLADSTQRRLDAANRVENSWLILDYLMGRHPEFRAELEEMPELNLIQPDKVTIEHALARRPEIAALRKAADAGESEVTEAKSAFYPEFFARAGLDYVQNDKVQEQAIYYATVGLRVNLFEGFASTARQRQAVLNRSRAKERLRLAEAQIRLELQTAKNDALVAAERIKTLEKSIRQGEENLRINQDRYSEHVGTATEVIDAQTLLTQVKTEYYRAGYAYQIALARISRALGEL